jgi:hypothetical protein
MSNWKKMDTLAIQPDVPANTSVASRLQSNLSALSNTRHVASGHGWWNKHEPSVGTGIDFPTYVPYVVPSVPEATTIAFHIAAETIRGDVTVTLVVDGVEGDSILWSGAANHTLTCPILGDLGWHRAALKIQSMTETATTAVGEVTRYGGGESVRFVMTAGTWPFSGDGKEYAELEITTLAAGIPQRLFFGTHRYLLSGEYILDVWPHIQSSVEWAVVASSKITATVNKLSYIEFTSVGIELRGDTIPAHTIQSEPGVPVASGFIGGIGDRLHLLAKDRQRWHVCAPTPSPASSVRVNTITGISIGLAEYMAYGSFGGKIPPNNDGSIYNVFTTVARCPITYRDTPTTQGIRGAILIAGTSGNADASRSWTMTGTIKNATGTIDLDESDSATHVLLDTTRSLAGATLNFSPGIWGCEDSIGENDLEQLTLAEFSFPWPSTAVPGSNYILEIALKSGYTNVHSRVYSVAVMDSPIGGF